MTLFSLLISFVNRELACVVDSVRQPWLSFKHDFSFYSDSVFTDYFWISTGLVCLTIPCVNMNLFLQSVSRVGREFFDAVDSIRQLPLILQWWFQGLKWLCFPDDFWISTGIACLTIPCVKQESIFAIGFTRRSWILWRCRHHTSAATHISVSISGSTVTLF